ncbi:hypothetical protein J1792_19105 [Streptomyces triculaminicus]|uniref:Uncharacterized protein n=1 Tax=Streptomyces triculaminicus TaxID=2816232 RepID=A0A939JN14_9ACTN|nr:hypothetical protein [Streptomyces triculaminicus]MBO0654806.1 hypothetical protein [Streptomyces triculaminicus]
MTPRGIDSRLIVPGAALGGAAIGWAGLEILRWADHAESRVCRKDPLQGCLTLYPLMGLTGWTAVSLLGLVILLWVLKVRPLALGVTTCMVVSLCTMMLWAEVGALERSWVFYLLSAAGPGLVAALRSPHMRRPAAIGLMALVTAFLVWAAWTTAH